MDPSFHIYETYSCSSVQLAIFTKRLGNFSPLYGKWGDRFGLLGTLDSLLLVDVHVLIREAHERVPHSELMEGKCVTNNDMCVLSVIMMRKNNGK